MTATWGGGNYWAAGGAQAALNRGDADAIWASLIQRASQPGVAANRENNEKLLISILSAPNPSSVSARGTAMKLMELRKKGFSEEVNHALALRAVLAMDAPIREAESEYPYSYLGEALDAFRERPADENSPIVTFRLRFAAKMADWANHSREISNEFGARVSITSHNQRIDPIYSEMVSHWIDDQKCRQHAGAVEYLLGRIEYYNSLKPGDEWRPKQLEHYGSAINALKRHLAKLDQKSDLAKQIKQELDKAGLGPDSEPSELFPKLK